MARFLKNRSAAIGQAPGSLVFIGTQKMEKPVINLISYNETEINTESEIDEIDFEDLNKSDKVSWLNIYGIHDISLIRNIGEKLNWHSLLMEDLLNTAQRPKVEDYDESIFLSLKMLSLKDDKVTSEQIGIVLSENYLISFQENKREDLNPIRERLNKSKGRIRKAKSDYLMYAILDTLVDSYHSIIEKTGYKIDELEDEIIDNVSKDVLEQIHNYKKEISLLHKVIRPVNELVKKLQRSHSDLIKEETNPFINDLSDISTHAVESIETYRSLLNDYQDLYNNSMNNKMNEIMKVLTIFASIFIPLTFIAGIYGTNFEYVPELSFKYSYFIMWGFMVVVAIIMLIIFRKRKWF